MASTRERVREHRQRLRAQGLRPVQIWVPDVRAPEFVAEAHRQSAAIAASEHEVADQAFVDPMSVYWTAKGGEATSASRLHEVSIPASRGPSSSFRTIGSMQPPRSDRKSTRLNSSHANISYAVFCLKK